MSSFFVRLLSEASNLSYDGYENDRIAGLFGAEHALFLLFTFSVVALSLFLSRRVKRARYELIFTIIAVLITLAEILKVILNVYSNAPPDNYLPLYFCGLFNFAIWLARSRIEFLSLTGYSYITMGGILAGIFFVFYPSTSLGMYSFFHPAVLHSAFFHGAMIYLGILTLMRGFYRPRRYHLTHYFVFVTVAAFLAAIINSFWGTNCMFLRDPFGLPILAPIQHRAPIAYMLIAWLGQAYFLFKISFWIYNFFAKLAIRSKRQQNGDYYERPWKKSL